MSEPYKFLIIRTEVLERDTRTNHTMYVQRDIYTGLGEVNNWQSHIPQTRARKRKNQRTKYELVQLTYKPANGNLRSQLRVDRFVARGNGKEYTLKADSFGESIDISPEVRSFLEQIVQQTSQL